MRRTKKPLIGGIIVSMIILGFSSSSIVCKSIEENKNKKNWNYTYGGKGSDMGKSLIHVADGGYIIAGTTNSNSYRYMVEDWWIVKVNENGTMMWNKTYGSSYESERVSSITKTSDRGFVVIGITDANDSTIIVKFNGSGTIEWRQQYTGRKKTTFSEVIETEDEGFLLVGKITDYISKDLVILKLNTKGTKEWEKILPFEVYTYFIPVRSSNEGFTLAGGGLSRLNRHISGSFLINIDRDGNVEWNKTYNQYLDNYPTDFVYTIDGGYALVSGDNNIVKIDQNGTVLWNKTITNQDFSGDMIVQTEDSGFILVESRLTKVIKTDKYGYNLWENTCKGHSEAIIKNAVGGCTLVGVKWIDDIKKTDLWIWNIQEEGKRIYYRTNIQLMDFISLILMTYSYS